MAATSKYSNIPAEEVDDAESDSDDGKDTSINSSKLNKSTSYLQVSAEASDEDSSDDSSEDGSERGTEQQPQAEAGAEGNVTTAPTRRRRKEPLPKMYAWIALFACIIICIGALIVLAVVLTHTKKPAPGCMVLRFLYISEKDISTETQTINGSPSMIY